MDEPAILAAIAAHPDEDTPRLAYADWLDENASRLPDPAAARVRAEFIRLQCEVHRLEEQDAPVARRYLTLQGQVHLWKRQHELLEHHRRDLLGPLADGLTETEMNRDVIFDRGFIAELRLDAGSFLRIDEDIFGLEPLPIVTVRDVNAWLPAICSNDIAKEVVTALEMQSDRPPEPLLLPLEETLSSGQPWIRLQRLSLEGCSIHPSDLQALAASTKFPALTDLDLSGNDIFDDGVRQLVASPLWPRLKRLVLGGNPISDEGADALADAAAASNLEYLNLRFTGLTTAGHRVLLRKFKRSTKLDLF